MDISTEYGPLATNLWKEYFTIFELNEIMCQKDDNKWKQVLSKIRVCNHTIADIELIMTHEISEEESQDDRHSSFFSYTRWCSRI